MVNPSGLCMCGCGNPTKISPKSNTEKGWTKGHPRKYLYGHQKSVHVRWTVDLVSGCWNTTQGVDYPKMVTLVGGKKTCRLVHVINYEEKFGLVPDGLELDHLCRNPRCVNPDHLEAVTHPENVRRGKAAKLNHKDARDIRESPLDSLTLSLKYQVDRSTIYVIRRGESWA